MSTAEQLIKSAVHNPRLPFRPQLTTCILLAALANACRGFGADDGERTPDKNF